MDASKNGPRPKRCQNNNCKCKRRCRVTRNFGERAILAKTLARCDGFSFVEVMVSLSILAIGVTGAAGMQLAALRSTQQSVFQTAAAQLAADAADVIRANGARLGSDYGISTFPEMDYQALDDEEPPVPAKLCHLHACNADERIEYEMYEWKRRVKSALPGGRIRICRDSHAWDVAVKALTWECDGEGDSSSPLVIKLGWQAKNPDGSSAADRDGRVPPSVAVSVIPA